MWTNKAVIELSMHVCVSQAPAGRFEHLVAFSCKLRVFAHPVALAAWSRHQHLVDHVIPLVLYDNGCLVFPGLCDYFSHVNQILLLDASRLLFGR